MLHKTSERVVMTKLLVVKGYYDVFYKLLPPSVSSPMSELFGRPRDNTVVIIPLSKAVTMMMLKPEQ